MSQIRLYFKDTAIRDDGQFLCLTDMWRAAGSEPSKRPYEWSRSKQAKDFSEFLAENTAAGNSRSELIRTEAGGRGGAGASWAHWQLGMAYAKYLSPEFHAWCNDVVRAVMRGRQLPDTANAALLSIAQTLTSFGEAIARMSERIDALATRPYGQVARHEAADIRFRLRRAARRAVALGQEKSERRARAGFDTRIRAACHWHGAGSRWEALPSAAFAWAEKALSEIERELDRAGLAQPERQLSLPEKKSN